MAVQAATKTIKLATGAEMPLIGLGTGIFQDDQSIKEVLGAFYKNGGRKIDTAACSEYYNEEQLGRGFKMLGIDRKTLFLNTKIWLDSMTYQGALKSVEKSLKDLQTDYLDLCHIHWPSMDVKGRLETWRAMEDLYAKGVIRALGVSNFYEEHITHLIENSREKPHVNQIEVHPGCYRRSTLDFCSNLGIVVEASSPLAVGNKEVLENPVIVEIAKKHGKSNGQVVLRWLTQHSIVPVPKSLNPGRVAQNVSIFDFELSPEEMARIDANTKDNKICSNYSDRLGGMKYDEFSTVEDKFVKA